MVIAIIAFISGIVILLLATQMLVRLAENASYALRISPLIVAIMLISIGTSLPEMAVSGISIVQGDVGLAMGNILGSHIINILLVLPVGILMGGLTIGTTKTQRNLFMLVTVTALFVMVQFAHFPPLLMGAILLLGAILVSIIEYQLAVQGRTKEDREFFRKTTPRLLGKWAAVEALASMFGVMLGGVIVVTSLEYISERSGISTTYFGLTLIAVVTSLPELVTTIYSQEHDEDKITVGNIIGSNIYNLLLIGGFVSCFSSNIVISPVTWVWLIASTGSLVLILRGYRGKTVPRWVGLVLLMFLVGFIVMQKTT